MSASHARSWDQMQPTAPKKDKQVVVKVRKQSWITKGEKVLYSIVGVCLLIAAIYMVSFASSTDTINRELQALENDVQQQKVQNEGLIYQKKELSRPERIVKIAEENGLQIQDAKIKQVSGLNK
ncbi:cell division protein FtsL [Virgibacillus phasianinus]|uniref:Cell division protein FtsL n=1 Tax=Virgibacillus phasianinus TaxID=2017483 RepID=A0A220U607_9BACI|nr:cell division protein FtsL [Virgibacillus phasianinus]ASK63588.1 cell division protein FtsL [Virgibacillus phasianinus]